MKKQKVISIGERCQLFEKLENGVVKCLACFHHCVLNPGPPSSFDPENSDPTSCIGICRVRHNFRSELRLMDHSYPIYQCFGIIEKIPLFHFYPKMKALFVGTSGCNMRCSFCQAWEISQLPKIKVKRRRKDGYLHDIEDSFLHDTQRMSPEEIVEKALKNGCGGIVMSLYNEPTVCFDSYILEIFRLSKSKGLKNILVSNGYQSIESINLIAKYVDAISIGLKSCSNRFYSSLCGARLTPILRNIRIWREMGVWTEIQTLLIPGESDSTEDIIGLCETMKSIDSNMVLHFAHYEDDYKFVEHLEPPINDEDLGRTLDPKFEEAVRIAKSIGLKFVYSDHSHSDLYHSTFCPDCSRDGQGGLLVWRGIGKAREDKGEKERKNQTPNFEVTYSFRDDGSIGRCKCGINIPGIWSDGSINPLVSTKLERVPDVYSQRNFVSTEGNDVTILYASQTGISEEYAKSLKRYGDEVEGLKKKLKIEVLDLYHYNETNLPKEKIVVIVTSTYFFGRIPRSGKHFYEYLMKDYDENGVPDLKNISYAVVGIGSTGDRKVHLKTYQVVAREIDRRMQEFGGRRIMMLEANKKSNFKRDLKEGAKNLWMLIQGKDDRKDQL